MYILRHFEVPRSDQTSHEVASANSRNLAHNLRHFIVLDNKVLGYPTCNLRLLSRVRFLLLLSFS